MDHCKTRGDEWASAVQSRIEYFDADLHAADCVYPQSCSINFLKMRNIPRQLTSAESTKRRKSGRLKDSDQGEAFESVSEFQEENDEEQLTISDLVTKMGETYVVVNPRRTEINTSKKSCYVDMGTLYSWLKAVVASKTLWHLGKKPVTFFVNTTIHLGRTMRKHRNERFSKLLQNSSKLISRMPQS